MNNAKLTPWLILITVIVVTLVGPFTVLKDITADNLTSQAYWLDLLAATIRSFSAAVLSAVALIAGIVGVPIIRSANSPTTQIVPTATAPTDQPKP